jgi:hypothetical protein
MMVFVGLMGRATHFFLFDFSLLGQQLAGAAGSIFKTIGGCQKVSAESAGAAAADRLRCLVAIEILELLTSY